MKEIEYYPNNKASSQDNVAIKIYGNRFHLDQSVYEYLIEFLLVFVSAKTPSGNGVMEFHGDEKLHYYAKPRIGFRRFIFFERAKKEKYVQVDVDAYLATKNILLDNISSGNTKEKEEFLNNIQDLFYGYAAVLKKRAWCAQALLPLCPEMILCEEMPNYKERIKGVTEKFKEKLEYGANAYYSFAETNFDGDRHNFLARGGELYYLHILQVLEQDNSNKMILEKLLKHLLTDSSKQFSDIINWIQSTWENKAKIDSKFLTERKHIGCIPKNSYINSGNLAVRELINYLSNNLHPIRRIDILAKGIMLQVMRMMTERTAEYLETQPRMWIIDMKSAKGGNVIKKLAAESYNNVCNDFACSINKCIEEFRDKHAPSNKEDDYKTFVTARKETIDLFKRLCHNKWLIFDEK